MNDLISVVVPVYNVDAYLRPCLRSITAQSYENLQIIMVDDGSTDESGRICDTFAEDDMRIQVVHEQNHGLSFARNTGIELCRGNYLMFVDSDDYIAPNMIQTLYELSQEYHAEISMCGYQMLRNGKQDPSQVFYEEEDIQIYARTQALGELLIDKKIQNYAWGKLYQRNLFQDVRYPVGKKYEDVQTTFHAMEHCNRLVKTKQCLYYYVMRKGSIVNTIAEQNTIDYIGQRIERYKYVKKKYPELKMQNQFCYLISCTQMLSDIFAGHCIKLLSSAEIKKMYQNFCMIYDREAQHFQQWMIKKDKQYLGLCRKNLKEFSAFVKKERSKKLAEKKELATRLCQDITTYITSQPHLSQTHFHTV